MCFLACVKLGAKQLKGLDSPSFQDESSPGHKLERFMISTVSRQVLNKLFTHGSLWLAPLSSPGHNLVSASLFSEKR